MCPPPLSSDAGKYTNKMRLIYLNDADDIDMKYREAFSSFCKVVQADGEWPLLLATRGALPSSRTISIVFIYLCLMRELSNSQDTQGGGLRNPEDCYKAVWTLLHRSHSSPECSRSVRVLGVGREKEVINVPSLHLFSCLPQGEQFALRTHL